jgi:hypothetical protein
MSRSVADTTKRAIYSGFSLYVPTTYSAGADHSIRLLGGSFFGLGNWELRNDLSLAADLPSGAQNGTRCIVGAMNYIEIGCDPTAGWFRMWLNDTLVYDGSCLSPSVLSTFDCSGGPLYGTDTFVLGNWYILDTTTAYCNTRLGAATRIITRPPQRDVSTQFTQPYPTGKANAGVVGAVLGSPLPPLVVGDTVGNTDYYASDDTQASGFSKVHAVVVRTVGQNLGTAPHSLYALIKSNGVEASADGPLLAIPNAYGMTDSVFYQDPKTNASWTAAAVAAAQFGVRIKS